MVSYAFNAKTGKPGELIRCFFRKIFNIPLKYSFFSIILVPLFDLIAVIIFAVCFLKIKYKYLNLYSEEILIIGLTFFIFLILFKMNILLKITFLSLFSWFLNGLAFFLLLKNFNFDISFLMLTFIHTTSGFLRALSMILEGLVFTAANTVSILKFQTILPDYRIPITSIIRLMTLWDITFLGILSLFIIRKEVFKYV